MKIYREVTPVGRDDVFIIKDCQNAHFDYPIHSHPEYELTFIENSAGNRIVGDSVETYTESDLVLIGPEVYHKWDDALLAQEQKGSAHVVVIQFDQMVFSNSLLSKEAFMPIRNLLDDAARGIQFYGPIVESAKKQIEQLNQLKGFEAVLVFFKLLNFLAGSKNRRYLASESFAFEPSVYKSERISKVCEYLQQNFTKRIQLSEVAAITNMSESAFSHFFKKRTNKSFTQFVIDMRIGHACKLLLETHDPVSQICYSCGFNNISNFNRLFKKYKKMTPYNYRHQYEKPTRIVPHDYQPLHKIS
ncbi:MAG: AraC family transcriptional regulator [Bacteroidota bacterium]